MKALIQRVSRAQVTVDQKSIGSIGVGLLVLLGAEKGDSEEHALRLCEKVINYRVFSDQQDKMNLSLKDVGGELLIVSQFTLAANTKKGRRPSFESAAAPSEGESLYDYFVAQAKESGLKVETGQFGANMQVELINDGPVTFLLQI